MLPQQARKVRKTSRKEQIEVKRHGSARGELSAAISTARCHAGNAGLRLHFPG